MRRWAIRAVAAAVLSLAALLAWNGWPRPIAPWRGKPAPSAARADSPRVELCRLDSQRLPTPRALVVTGWGMGTAQLAVSAILVRHPSGPLLIDAVHGRAWPQDLARAPSGTRVSFGSPASPLGALLEEARVPPESVSRVVVTHAHFDHVGGLRDLPRALVDLWRPALEFARARRGVLDQGVMPHQLEGLGERLQGFDMDGPAVEVFDASHDVLGDGSVVAVPLPGHTPGNVGVLVNAADGRRYLFAGDAADVREGVARPAHKGRLMSAMSDSDLALAGDSLARLHALAEARPELVIVPCHDARALEQIAKCR